MHSYISLLILFVFIWSVRAEKRAEGLFDNESTCRERCSGEHDSKDGCTKNKDGSFVCRCVSNFYSVRDTCEAECESNQYWSLFTYGSCNEYASTVLPGSCNLQCVFRVRVWATVFIVVLFVAAVIIILVTLPMCVINLWSCIRVRKQHRAIEDMHVAGEISGPGKSTNAHPMTTVSPWQQYPYYSYYHAR